MRDRKESSVKTFFLKTAIVIGTILFLLSILILLHHFGIVDMNLILGCALGIIVIAIFIAIAN